MIRGSRKGGSVTAGEWKPENKQMEITTHPSFTKEDYRWSMEHEIGHAKFKMKDPGKIQKWNAAVKEISPPTKYAQWHESRAFNYKMNNISVTKEDMPIVQRNITALENLYYEEIHSEVYSHLKQPLNPKQIWSKEGLDKAVAIYKEMFGNA